MGGTVAALATIVLVSGAFGHGFLTLCGAPAWTWTAPAVGLALAIVAAALAIRLPGEGATAALVLGGLTLAALAALAWRPRRLAGLPEAAISAALVLAGALIPFLVNARFGLLGVSFNDDANRHLLAIEFLRSDGEVPLSVFGLAYPIGPHALMAAVAAGTGVRADQALDGLLIAIPVLTAFSALPLFGSRPRWPGAVGAAVSAMAYLAAAYYVSAAFKETLMALLVLAFAVTLHQAAQPGRATAFALAALAAACVYTYSYPGLAWPLGALALWGAAELVMRAPEERRQAALTAARRAAPAVALLVLALLPALASLASLFESVRLSPAGTGAIKESNTGYTIDQLSPAEGLGVWPSGDYRLAPNVALLAWPAAAVGVAALLFGLAWSLRRRELALPAAIATAALLYAYFRVTQSPWISAKALVILSPLAVATGARALLASRVPVWRAVLATGFVAAAAGSALLHLRTGQVEPPGHRSELMALAPLVRDDRVLLLTADDYGAWRLFDATVSQPGANVPVRPEKRYRDGDPVDFDSPLLGDLAAHRYVITTRAAYGSAPPPGLRVVRRTPSFVLWRRDAAQGPRATLDEGSAPGAPLDCATPAGRALAARGGVALVTPEPVETRLSPTLRAGGTVSATLALPPGRWDLSLQYRSPRRLTLRGPRSRSYIAPNLDRIGSFWPAGALRVDGPADGGPAPVTVTLSMEDESLPVLRRSVALLGRLAATRADLAPRPTRLRRACGRYVDWFAP